MTLSMSPTRVKQIFIAKPKEFFLAGKARRQQARERREFFRCLDKFERLDSFEKGKLKQSQLNENEKGRSSQDLSKVETTIANVISLRYGNMPSSDLESKVESKLRAERRAAVATGVVLGTIGIGVLVADSVFQVPWLMVFGYVPPVVVLGLAALSLFRYIRKNKLAAETKSETERCEKIIASARGRAQSRNPIPSTVSWLHS